MKTLLTHVLLLVAALVAACTVPGRPATTVTQSVESPAVAAHPAAANVDDGKLPLITASDEAEWRRTVDGWEPLARLLPAPASSEPEVESWLNFEALHPVTWASLVLLISVGAILLWHPTDLDV